MTGRMSVRRPIRAACTHSEATATRRHPSERSALRSADLKAAKKFLFGSRASFEIGLEVMNVFDTPNFNHSVTFDPDDSFDTFRVTSAYTDINTTYDPGGRIGQLTWRINW
jgi:hypothetical protein